MAFAHQVLGLLEAGPQHGYELKHRYDDQLAPGRQLPYGQVYATLARLERDGLADVAGVESGAGPDRKRYVITPEGVADLERWLDTPTEVTALRSELFARVVIAMLSGRDPDAILDAQRAVHLARMREVTDRRREADLIDAMAWDLELHHLGADLTWIEDASTRIRTHLAGTKGTRA